MNDKKKVSMFTNWIQKKREERTTTTATSTTSPEQPTLVQKKTVALFFEISVCERDVGLGVFVVKII